MVFCKKFSVFVEVSLRVGPYFTGIRFKRWSGEFEKQYYKAVIAYMVGFKWISDAIIYYYIVGISCHD